MSIPQVFVCWHDCISQMVHITGTRQTSSTHGYDRQLLMCTCAANGTIRLTRMQRQRVDVCRDTTVLLGLGDHGLIDGIISSVDTPAIVIARHMSYLRTSTQLHVAHTTYYFEVICSGGSQSTGVCMLRWLYVATDLVSQVPAESDHSIKQVVGCL
jgi:hypothetical protein